VRKKIDEKKNQVRERERPQQTNFGFVFFFLNKNNIEKTERQM
jgi:hypothetical protein